MNLLTATPEEAAMNLLTATPEEAALNIACAVACPKSLVALALACRRYATKRIAAPRSRRGGDATATAEGAEGMWLMWSIAEEAGRRWLEERSEQERGWVPRRRGESWLGLMWEVALLHSSAAKFSRDLTNEKIALTEDGTRATRIGAMDYSYRTATSKTVMRAGRHYAEYTVHQGEEYTVDQGKDTMFGVMRPGPRPPPAEPGEWTPWCIAGGQNACCVQENCFYSTSTGDLFPGQPPWQGMQPTDMADDRVGLLLDLDQGSLTVYKNDERLGVMVVSGLRGEYCWAAELGIHGSVVSIQAVAPPPPSPTADELAHAAAWQREHAPPPAPTSDEEDSDDYDSSGEEPNSDSDSDDDDSSVGGSSE